MDKDRPTIIIEFRSFGFLEILAFSIFNGLSDRLQIFKACTEVYKNKPRPAEVGLFKLRVHIGFDQIGICPT